MTSPADIYLRFLQLVEALNGLPTLAALDPLEQRVLDHVARSRQAGGALSVRQLIAEEQFGSPATLHARLTSMRKKGWLMLCDTEDARRKDIQLTPAALDHFGRLSDCLLRAAQTKS